MLGLFFCTALLLHISLVAQIPDGQPRRPDGAPGPRIPPPGPRPDFDGPPPRGGFGGPGGPGAPQADLKLVSQFDKDGNKRLDGEERKAARQFLADEKAAGRGRRGPGRGGPPGPRADDSQTQKPPEPGPKLSPADVKSFADAPLYEPGTLRTLFLEFENANWEEELSDFYHTDVEVPATLTVDGKTYKGVGVHFRGASSFFTVAAGRKHSLNLSLDFTDGSQRLYGYRTLNLLNSHTDPTFLRTLLFYEITRQFIPAPKANYVRVVINGESWGIYVNAQQVNKEFTKEFFDSTKGARWKVPGSPRGDGGLTYIGDDVAEYRKRYEIKSKDDPKSWSDLIHLCRVLNETPSNKLEAALAPLLDIDGTLKFLALENVFINNDGYWIRSSDFNLCQDDKGQFHIVPHDANETWRRPQGPGMGRRGGGEEQSINGVELDPLAGANDSKKPLLNKLLAVPSLRARYFGYVRQITEQWLDWKKIGPLAEKYQALIAADVKTDGRKLDSFEAFSKGVAEDAAEEAGRGPRRPMSLKSFVEQRRAYLLNHSEVKNARVVAAK